MTDSKEDDNTKTIVNAAFFSDERCKAKIYIQVKRQNQVVAVVSGVELAMYKSYLPLRSLFM